MERCTYIGRLGKLQLVVKDYEMTFGQEHTNTLTATDKLAVVRKKHEDAEAEKARKAAMEAKMKEKLPIKFKDAVGRNFQFPFDLARTWAVSYPINLLLPD